RHRDEIEDGATTLTDEQYQTLQTYRRALRDWPESERFPQSEYRPAQPEWLLGALSKH
ncbi:phage tail protein, partial [Pseudomonas aeruginosa]